MHNQTAHYENSRICLTETECGAASASSFLPPPPTPHPGCQAHLFRRQTMQCKQYLIDNSLLAIEMDFPWKKLKPTENDVRLCHCTIRRGTLRRFRFARKQRRIGHHLSDRSDYPRRESHCLQTFVSIAQLISQSQLFLFVLLRLFAITYSFPRSSPTRPALQYFFYLG